MCHLQFQIRLWRNFWFGLGLLNAYFGPDLDWSLLFAYGVEADSGWEICL